MQNSVREPAQPVLKAAGADIVSTTSIFPTAKNRA
jgi:hypothetical protein